MEASEVRRAIAFACLALVAACAGPVAAGETEKQDEAASATRSQDAALDAIVDEAVKRYHLPGIAVGVIEDGRVAYTATRGEIAAGSGEAIDRKTRFKIASNSKAMTASVLARLVDAGKLRWDDPVIKYLPKFRMYDPWVTQQMQVKDLLVHNSGLPEGGGDLMLWPEPNHFSRDDIIAGLAHIKPAYSFRSGYAYDNLLYVVAGEVAAAAGGASYEELMRREVFQPLGLSRCRVGEWNRDDVGNVAQPHVRSAGRYVASGDDGATVPELVSAAAGGIRCSLDDMLSWARNWLVPDAAQSNWLSAKQRQAMWAPRTPMPISARRQAWDGTRFYAYGYGWRIADVDGEMTVSHTGTLSGMYSVMTLLPDRKSGFVVLIAGHLQHQGLSCRIFRPHRFGFATCIMVYERICGIQNHLGGAIILFQLDHGCFRIIFFEIQNIADVCATPSVNALVRVADHAQVAVLRRQPPGQGILRVVGVLILIDQNITEPLLIFLQDERILFEQTNRHIHQIVEIHGVVGDQLFLIKFVNARYPLLIIVVGLSRKLSRCDQLILGIGNRADDTTNRKLTLRQFELLQALTDQ